MAAEPQTLNEVITTVEEVDVILASLTKNQRMTFTNAAMIDYWLGIRFDIMQSNTIDRDKQE